MLRICPRCSSNQAFSLVELSIVLVILGLLTGGILAGQSLIRAAELRKVTSDMTRYKAAIYAFRDKYFYLPGDLPNATSFWGAADSNATTCITTPTTDGKTCNGNGDGVVETAPLEETFRAPQQLANAGLIEGNYPGVGATANAMTGTMPKTGGNAVLYLITAGTFTNSGGSAVNFPMFGFSGGPAIGMVVMGDQNFSAYPFLKPEEAWNIDTKMDDGGASTGRLFGVTGRTAASTWTTGCTTPDTAGSYTGNPAYTLSSSSKACILYYFFY